MTLNNNFTVFPTATFKKEFLNIFNYIKYNLKEPLTADRFYKTVLQEISTLNFMPERYIRIFYPGSKNKNLRKFTIDNYVIIYEVVYRTRASFYFTYISQYSKLFKSFII